VVEKWWREEKEGGIEKEKRRQCIFVDDWSCSIKNKDIPLRVCEVCIDARKVAKKKDKE